MITLKQVSEILNKQRDTWYRGTHQGNDGNQGNTLEGLLGVSENNLQLPDLGSIELKTSKNESGSMLTLFHKEPNPAASVPKIIRAIGWKHQKAGIKYGADEMRFSSTTYGHKHTSRGMIIRLTNTRVEFVYDPSHVKRSAADLSKQYLNLGAWSDNIETRGTHYSTILPVYWDRTEFEAICKRKLDHTLMVYCDVKLINGEQHFKYTDAYVYSDFNPSKLNSAFSSGDVVLDFDARTNKNHGVKFRIKKARISALFDKFQKVL
jgi:hypothetical protein